MSAGKKKSQSKKPRSTATKRLRAKARVPVHGMADFTPEDTAALSFSLVDARAFIEAAGIEPIPGLVLDEVIARLEKAVEEFLLSWRRNTSSSPGEIQDWAQLVRKSACDFLEVMRADPNDGRLALENRDVYLTLLRYPQIFDQRGEIDEPQEAYEIRRTMGLRPSAYRRNLEVQELYTNLDQYPDAYMPGPIDAIKLTLRGVAYSWWLADNIFQYHRKLGRRPRQPDQAVDVFAADINRLYEFIFARKGSVTTDSYHREETIGAIQRGAVIDFTQAVVRRTADSLPAKSLMPGDSGMRDALVDLAENKSSLTGRIRKVRSAKWRAAHPARLRRSSGI